MGGPASLTLRHIAPMRERAEDACNEVRAELDRLEAANVLQAETL